MTDEDTKMVANAKAAIQRDREERAEGFSREYQELCERWACEFVLEIVSAPVPLQGGSVGFVNVPRKYISVKDGVM